MIYYLIIARNFEDDTKKSFISQCHDWLPAFATILKCKIWMSYLDRYAFNYDEHIATIMADIIDIWA